MVGAARPLLCETLAVVMLMLLLTMATMLVIVAHVSYLYRIVSLVPARFDCIFGPAYKGITLAAAQPGS